MPRVGEKPSQHAERLFRQQAETEHRMRRDARKTKLAHRAGRKLRHRPQPPPPSFACVFPRRKSRGGKAPASPTATRCCRANPDGSRAFGSREIRRLVVVCERDRRSGGGLRRLWAKGALTPARIGRRGQRRAGALRRWATFTKSSCSGQAVLNGRHTRRVLRTMMAPSLSSGRWMVPTWARANSVSARSRRRMASRSR